MESIQKVCLECNTPFVFQLSKNGSNKGRAYCSKTCTNRANGRRHISKAKPRNCEGCGNPFITKHSGSRFCSRICSGPARMAIQREKLAGVVRECAYCSAEFTPKRTSQNYCDSKCSANAEARRNGRRRTYGIDNDRYAEMLELQNGVCAICGSEPNPGRTLHVDHCHYGDERIRGLLCSGCNTGIGLLRDDPARLRAAIAYLEKHHGAEQN